MVVNIEETVDAIKTAVEQASEQSKIEIKSVNVGIAGHHIKSLQNRGSVIRENADAVITDEELNNLRNNMYRIGTSPGEEIINVIPQEYFVDGETTGNKSPRGMVGNKIEANYHIIIGQSAAVRNIITCINLAGLEMDNMFLEPIASASAVLCEEEKEAGVAIVDIGGGTTDIAVFYDSVICHTAVIPFGGNIITEDIRQGCSILKKQAEEIKVRFGSAVAMENSEDEVVSIPGIRGREPKEISFKNLSYIIQARLEEIFDLVKFEIEKVNVKHKLATGIVLTGGGSMMKHIAQLAEFKTGMEVRLGNPNESLAKDKEELSCPMYSTGIGLVLEGFAKYESDVNKISQNKEMKKEQPVNIEVKEEVETPEPKKTKKKPFSIKDIITNFSNLTGFFKQEDIE